MCPATRPRMTTVKMARLDARARGAGVRLARAPPRRPAAARVRYQKNSPRTPALASDVHNRTQLAARLRWAQGIGGAPPPRRGTARAPGTVHFGVNGPPPLGALRGEPQLPADAGEPGRHMEGHARRRAQPRGIRPGCGRRERARPGCHMEGHARRRAQLRGVWPGCGRCERARHEGLHCVHACACAHANVRSASCAPWRSPASTPPRTRCAWTGTPRPPRVLAMPRSVCLVLAAPLTLCGASCFVAPSGPRGLPAAPAGAPADVADSVQAQ